MADVQPTLPFDECSRKHGGQRNSQKAFTKVAPGLVAMRERIRVFITACGPDGATPKEVAVAFGKEWHTLSGRFKTMREKGLLFDSGRDRDGSTVHVARREWVNGSERIA